MKFKVRFTPDAADDLERLFEFLLDREGDLVLAERALEAIRMSIQLLEHSPFCCRKAVEDNPLLRELIIPFGASGYLALFEVENEQTVTMIAVRHQREEDYH
ncbi:type II toxin-antitoxin system RelE/ParE family toxin [Pseudomarimonas arenosa]|uniref:Type II toxin-antitoxin system RelE/ParE family toxin n=1 Tax=Pseudomarimonas arenosa TaxID=2774145 RepID=A0AAW3ZQV3_9GAMM|nr:type II toxin-antitoxin system RelE/ParE family toxin [Pseudomarimonas arenosa]